MSESSAMTRVAADGLIGQSEAHGLADLGSAAAHEQLAALLGLGALICQTRRATSQS